MRWEVGPKCILITGTLRLGPSSAGSASRRERRLWNSNQKAKFFQEWSNPPAIVQSFPPSCHLVKNQTVGGNSHCRYKYVSSQNIPIKMFWIGLQSKPSWVLCPLNIPHSLFPGRIFRQGADFKWHYLSWMLWEFGKENRHGERVLHLHTDVIRLGVGWVWGSKTGMINNGAVEPAHARADHAHLFTTPSRMCWYLKSVMVRVFTPWAMINSSNWGFTRESVVKHLPAYETHVG